MTDTPFKWDGKGDLRDAIYSPIRRAPIPVLVDRPSVLFQLPTHKFVPGFVSEISSMYRSGPSTPN